MTQASPVAITPESFLADLIEQRKALAACTVNDYVLCWPQHGLGVLFKDGKTHAVSVLHATGFNLQNIPARPVTNGRREKAEVMLRQEAINEDLAELDIMIDKFTTKQV